MIGNILLALGLVVWGLLLITGTQIPNQNIIVGLWAIVTGILLLVGR